MQSGLIQVSLQHSQPCSKFDPFGNSLCRAIGRLLEFCQRLLLMLFFRTCGQSKIDPVVMRFPVIDQLDHTSFALPHNEHRSQIEHH